MVAATFLAMPPGPTRAQSASASSPGRGRGSHCGCARRTSSTWMKYSTVFIGPSKGRSSLGGPWRTLSTSFVHVGAILDRPPDLVGVPGQRRPYEAWSTIGSPFTNDEMRRQIARGPAFTQGWRVRTQLHEQVADGFPFLLGEDRLLPSVHPRTGRESARSERRHPIGQRHVPEVAADILEVAGRALPVQRRDVVEQGGIDPKRGELTEELRQFALARESFGQFGGTSYRVAQRRIPLGHPVRNPVELPVVGQHERCRTLAPPGQSGKPVGGVADERQPIGDGSGAPRRTSPRPGPRCSPSRSGGRAGRPGPRRRTGRGPCPACR